MLPFVEGIQRVSSFHRMSLLVEIVRVIPQKPRRIWNLAEFPLSSVASTIRHVAVSVIDRMYHFLNLISTWPWLRFLHNILTSSIPSFLVSLFCSMKHIVPRCVLKQVSQNCSFTLCESFLLIRVVFPLILHPVPPDTLPSIDVWFYVNVVLSFVLFRKRPAGVQQLSLLLPARTARTSGTPWIFRYSLWLLNALPIHLEPWQKSRICSFLLLISHLMNLNSASKSWHSSVLWFPRARFFSTCCHLSSLLTPFQSCICIPLRRHGNVLHAQSTHQRLSARPLHHVPFERDGLLFFFRAVRLDMFHVQKSNFFSGHSRKSSEIVLYKSQSFCLDPRQRSSPLQKGIQNVHLLTWIANSESDRRVGLQFCCVDRFSTLSTESTEYHK